MNRAPHIKPVERPVEDEDPPVIAMRNIPFKLSEYEPRILLWRVKWAFFWGVMVFVAMWYVVVVYGEDMLSPRAQTMMERVAAGLFLLMVIANFVVDFGWRGGGKDINRSNTDVI